MKPSLLLAIAGWTSTFVLTWMIILGFTELYSTTGAMILFLGIAIISSAIYAPPKSKEQKKND